MSKVIADTLGLAHAIQRQFGCDRQLLEELIERFSEDMVIAGDYDDVACTILHIARESADRDEEWGDADSLLADSSIKFEHILNEYRKTDWVDVGFTYEALKEAVLEFHTKEECEWFVQRSV